MTDGACRRQLAGDDASAYYFIGDKCYHMSAYVVAEGLGKVYKKDYAVKDLSFTIGEGEIFGLLGPNGAGKTTTIQLLLGLRRAQGGSMRILGREAPRDLPRILAATGYVPERPHLYTYFTVAQAIRYHGAFYARFDWVYAEDLRRGFHLPPESRLSRLSKGELGKLLQEA